MTIAQPSAQPESDPDPSLPPRDETPDPALLALGARLYKTQGCTVCHDSGVGPPHHALAGSHVRLTDGEEIVVTPEYLRQSIVDPSSEVVAGYNPVMPTFGGHLSDHQLDALVAYLLSR